MHTNQPPHALLIAFHRIGDLTVSTPLLRAIARRRRLSLLTRPFGAPLLAGQPYLERVWTLPYPHRGGRGLARALLGGHRRALGRQLARAGIDEVLIYDTERELIRRWLQDVFPGRVRQIARRAPPGTHVSELCRMGAASLGCDMVAYEPHPVLEVDDDARDAARARLGGLGERVVGIQMGSQRTHARRLLGQRPNLKSLAPSQWRDLVARLLASDHADAIALHGAPSERSLVRRFVDDLAPASRERCHDFTDVGLDLLPALLAEHDALISVDTGTAHIAAAVRCPLLVLFGPTDPAVFAPRGSGDIEVLLGRASCQFCHGTPLYKECRNNVCLNRLEHGTLWNAWLRLRGAMRPTVPLIEA